MSHVKGPDITKKRARYHMEEGQISQHQKLGCIYFANYHSFSMGEGVVLIT